METILQGCVRICWWHMDMPTPGNWGGCIQHYGWGQYVIERAAVLWLCIAGWCRCKKAALDWLCAHVGSLMSKLTMLGYLIHWWNPWCNEMCCLIFHGAITENDNYRPTHSSLSAFISLWKQGNPHMVNFFAVWYNNIVYVIRILKIQHFACTQQKICFIVLGRYFLKRLHN
jgi:hypothetical protein